VALSFNRLLPASVLSWQRSTFHVNEVFECLVEEEHEVLRKAELSMEADSENYLGGSSETICTTSDLTFTRKRSATA
jgi:hypothetical protein